jgi:hypothetical protein
MKGEKAIISLEKALQNRLIIHPPHPYIDLAAQEWFVVPGRVDKGRGDLVFKSPTTKPKYLVVETKHLSTAHGRNACSTRTHRRQKVREQAKTYGKAWKEKHPSASVQVATYTNIDGLKKLGRVENTKLHKCKKGN